MTGYSIEEVLGKSPRILQGPRTNKKILEQLKNTIRQGKSSQGEVINYKKDGSEFHLKWSIHPIKDAHGNLSHFLSIQEDISESKEIIYLLKRTVEQLQFHVENTSLGCITFDSELKIKKCSSQAETVLGWDKKQLIGQKLTNLSLIHPEEINEVEEKLMTLLQNKTSDRLTFNARITSNENTVKYTEWYNSAMFDEKGRFLSFYTLIRDVTSHKIAEKALIEGQELERKRIAREIHDSIGQMLVAVKFNIASLEETLPLDFMDRVHALEDLVQKTIEEARRLSQNLAPRSLDEFGLEAGIRNLCLQTQNTTGINITFQYIGESYIADKNILISIYRITQEALTNVVKHARAKNVKILFSQNEKSISLLMEDDGVGFKTEKVILKKGSGLYNIEERTKMLGGRFQIVSMLNEGTKISINLPNRKKSGHPRNE
jgi:PAS domain S-box-containing protein